MWLHRDASMLPGFPRKLSGSANTGDGASSPVLVDLDGDNKNELVVGGSDGIIHAFRPDGSELPGWPVHDRSAAAPHGRAGVRQRRRPLRRRWGGARLDRRGRRRPRRRPGGLRRRHARARSTAGGPDGHQLFHEQSESRLLRQAAGALRQLAPRQVQPDAARLHRLTGARRPRRRRPRRSIAASMDRHVYAWHIERRPGAPASRCWWSTRARSSRSTRRPTRSPSTPTPAPSSRARSSTRPAVGDLDGGERPTAPRSWSAPTRSTTADSDGGVNADLINGGALRGSRRPACSAPATRRLYAIEPDGDRRPDLATRATRSARLAREDRHRLHRASAGRRRGRHRLAGRSARSNCPSGGQGAKVSVMPAAGLAYVLNPNGSPATADDADGSGHRARSPTSRPAPQKYDTTTTSAVGHPAFGEPWRRGPASACSRRRPG